MKKNRLEEGLSDEVHHDSVLVRFNNKDYYVSYADLLNKANNKLFAYEDKAMERNAKINGKTLMINKKDMEDKMKNSIKMPSPMPGSAKTESKNFKENKMTTEQKLRKYIREQVIRTLEDSPYGKPDEQYYLSPDGMTEQEGEGPSPEELETKQKTAQEKSKKDAYKRFFSQALAKFGYSTPSSIPDEKKKSFFDYIDQEWLSKKEKSVGKK